MRNREWDIRQGQRGFCEIFGNGGILPWNTEESMLRRQGEETSSIAEPRLD